MKSLPTNDLPLADILQFAADNGLTASIDLRNRVTAGRIDIREGQIIDAYFGGLVAEQAVYAAIRSADLSVHRGHARRRSVPSKITLSTQELLREGLRRKSEPPNAAVDTTGEMVRSIAVRDSTSMVTSGPRRRLGQLRSKHLRLGLFGLLSLALVTLLGSASWQWLSGVGLLSQPSLLESTARSLGDRDKQSANAAVIPPRLLASGQLSVNRELLGAMQSMLVNVLVDETGRAIGTKLEHSNEKSAALENAAIAFLLNSKFDPAIKAGQAITAWLPIEITFDRQGEASHAGAIRNSAGAVLTASVMPPAYAGLDKLPAIQGDRLSSALTGKL